MQGPYLLYRRKGRVVPAIFISVVLWPDPNIFLCIPVSAADAAKLNPNGIKTLLANG